MYDKYNDKAYDALSSTEKANLSHRIANSWEAAKWLAQNGTGGGSTVNDTYLATITSSLENSLAAPTGEIPLFVGGKGSGSSVNPADPDHSDGYYWVTGPEGEAPGGKGTKFADNSGTPLPNYYAKWHTGRSEASHSTTTEPNNSGPYVTVGYGVTSNWDDVATSAGTTKGFVQEKNLAHSGLEVQAGSGQVDLKGNAGLSVGLKNLTINTTGNVTVGGGKSAAGTTYTGQIRTDEGVSIHGADVTVGDRITSINNGVNIQATGNIHVDGITAHDKINLTTTGADGVIVLGSDHNDGSLNTASTENDAVIIDARGANGAFKNQTSDSAKNAITTGTGGNWKVYSASPDRDEFGTNLNSGTNAQWGATSTSYSASKNDGNKYIFQVKPTVYVTANDMKKVYGEKLTNDNVTTTAEATFTGQDNKEHNVNAYTDAFTEGDVSDYYNGSGTFKSEGWAKTATRTGGDKAPASEPENNAIYNIKATSSESYNLTAKGTASGYADATTKDGGTVEILRREINVKGSGNQTYGNETIDWTLTAKLAGTQSGVTGDALVNGDTLDNSTDDLSIKAGSSYAENQNGRTTADANENPYTDAVNMASVGFENGAGVNYTIVDATGDLKVNKAALTVNVGNAETVYGTPFKESDYDYAYSTETGKSLVNGDTKESLAAGLGKIDYDNEAALDGTTTGKWTKAVGDNYTLTFTNGTKSAFDALNNYNVTIVDGKAKVTPYTITKEDIVAANPTFTTVYGTTTTPVEVKFKGTNGDAEISNTATTTAYIYDADGNPVKTENVGDHAYDIKSTLTNSNYQFADGATSMVFEKTASVTPADLTIQIGNTETVYGTKFDESKYGYSYASGITNGDTEATLDAALDGMDYTNDAALDGTDGKWTKDVGDYALTGKGVNSLTNYTVTYLDGTATITPYTISREEVVNLDGTPLYTTKYGQKDAFGTATFKGVNGDGTYELAITDSSALVNAGGKVTQDVGHNIYDTTVELSEAMNGNYQFADGATSKTFEKTASVTPAELTITTKDVETEYGTVKTTTSDVDGLVNGDLPAGFIFDYGDYGGAYLDGNTKTNDVDTYHFGTTLSGAEFLKNYTITGGEADVKIDPKDVTFFVSGTGNTLADVTYTVTPDIDAQLAYGEHVDADYTPGNTVGDNQYGVVANINGTPIISGNVGGNYRYNYEGLITITPQNPTVPTKPDIDPHNPSNLDGSGSWTSNMGNHGVPGVERVAGLASAELPFFKVEAGQVSHYGTYDVAADPDKVRLEPTGKRLPEPNQPKTQYREYTKALTTTDGTGMFRMVYDGSTFNITPVDDGALALMRMGDVKNNVELSAEALHAGFSEMGILLEDLDGVYVHFDSTA